MQPVAAIDIGTNSVLMCVATRQPAGQIALLADEARITRLGEGVDARGELDPGAALRTLTVLQEYRAIADRHGARIVAAGTSALRDAHETGRAFVDHAERILRAGIEIVSGAREATLTYHGALDGLELGGGPCTVVDVGGGSTELAQGEQGHLHACTSMQLGSVRLYERYVASDPVAEHELQAVDREISRVLDAHHVAARPNDALVGVGATATTVAAIATAKPLEEPVSANDPWSLHGCATTVAECSAVAERLSKMTIARRRAVLGIDPGRADVIIVGARILAAIAQRIRPRSLCVSNGGVRIGLALEALTVPKK